MTLPTFRKDKVLEAIDKNWEEEQDGNSTDPEQVAQQLADWRERQRRLLAEFLNDWDRHSDRQIEQFEVEPNPVSYDRKRDADRLTRSKKVWQKRRQYVMARNTIEKDGETFVSFTHTEAKMLGLAQ
jgi:TATA-binding protein-associated factor Taf7